MDYLAIKSAYGEKVREMKFDENIFLRREIFKNKFPPFLLVVIMLSCGI